MEIDNIEEYIRIDKSIDEVEERSDNLLRQAHRARWEFGKLMLIARGHRKQLPNGYLDELAQQTGRSRSDLQQRMWFATSYPTRDEVFQAVNTPDGTCKSWSEVRRAIPKPPEDEDEGKKRKRDVEAEERKARRKAEQAERDAKIADLKDQGQTIEEISNEVGLNQRSVDNALRAERARREAEAKAKAEAKAEAEAEAELSNWKPSWTAQQKFDAAIRKKCRELEKEFDAKLDVLATQKRAEADQIIADYKAKLDA